MSPWQMAGLPARAPRAERRAELDVLAWEAALGSAAAARNGHALPGDVVWLVSHRALAAPATAARCPHVRAALPPDVAAAVARLALTLAPAVTAVDGQASQPAGLPAGPLSTGQAAAALGLTTHAVRAACRRGRLAATRDQDGQWQISETAIENYRRHHGRTASE